MTFHWSQCSPNNSGILLPNYSSSERSESFLITECFFTCSWRFLIPYKLEQSEFKLEKLEFRNMQEKLEN